MWDERFTSKFIFLRRPPRGGFLATCGLFGALFLSGCNGKTDLQTFCEALPTAQSDVLEFQAELTPYIPAVLSGRRLASVVEPKAIPSVDLRGQWFVWTERALKRMQWAKDALESEHKAGQARQILSATSISLVSLHGYIDQQKWRKASAELAKVDDQLRQVVVLTCPQRSTP